METYKVVLGYDPKDISDCYCFDTRSVLVNGFNELTNLLNLVGVSKRYKFISVETIPYINPMEDILEELMKEQIPDGLETGE